ncbi:hypothetical protein HELRODRAFT_170438 [Helobdella robusta]|uniref:HMG box domain-containing protein n=1 Tax=Helobdella robusta TaxID=6412 RepID=T1F325_HELRO|nr:hypothetical protein HELRODRAFT_170438 [Helobdella robusta]ESO07136.1 hypothetical protein HELRODRAFT_170438 [Helobdella robusta]
MNLTKRLVLTSTLNLVNDREVVIYNDNDSLDSRYYISKTTGFRLPNYIFSCCGTKTFMRGTTTLNQPAMQSNRQPTQMILHQQQQQQQQPRQQFQQQFIIASQPTQQHEFTVQQQQQMVFQQQPQQTFSNQFLQFQSQTQPVQVQFQQVNQPQHFQQQHQLIQQPKQQHQLLQKSAKVYTTEQVLQQIISNDDHNDNNGCEVDYEPDPDFFLNEVEEVIGDTQEESTLWMSCSPGRDSADGDDNENEETTVVSDFSPSYESLKRYNPVNNSYDSVEVEEEEEEEECEEEPAPVKQDEKKPISSYGLFFRDTQAAIEEQKPDVTFSEVAHVVAKMWDELEDKHKQYYEKLADLEKLKARKERKKMSNDSGKMNDKLQTKKPKERKKPSASSTEMVQSRPANQPMCVREGCSNRAINDTRWNLDYCSTQCVVSHCKDVFKSWVAHRKDPNPEVEAC